MKKFISVILAICIILFAGFYIYTADYYIADDTAKKIYTQIEVNESKDYISIIPNSAQRGFVFYPGGKVEPQAYLPLAEKISQNNIAVMIAKMPFNLAVFDMAKADKIIAEKNDIKSWYIGGHSLGGAIAASFVAENSDCYSGLVLLGAYSTADLKKSDVQVLTITATEDKVMNWDSYEKYYDNLPTDKKEITIEGGCHSYFGNYGMQKGDGMPEITREEQMTAVAGNIVDFILNNGKI